MGIRGLQSWADSTTTYTPEQVRSVLTNVGVEIAAQTWSDYLCFCPFHGNTRDPAFSVGIENGLFVCFNPSCGVSGTLPDLVQKMSGKKLPEATRFIVKHGNQTVQQARQRVKDQLNKKPPEPWAEDAVVAMAEAFQKNEQAQAYMMGRGFNSDTLEFFQVGWSPKQGKVVVPMRGMDGACVGFIGRSITDKTFKNTPNLPVKESLWNIHNARKERTAIITEATFDAMRIHQVGFPGVVATLGGTITPDKFAQLERHFDRVIIFTDYDEPAEHKKQDCKKCGTHLEKDCKGHNPGRQLGNNIAAGLRGRGIFWAVWDEDERLVYPEGAKDAGDLEDAQIRRMVNNAIPNFDYQAWRVAT